MQSQLDAMRAQLRSCCPQCKSVQCTGVAHDVCCDVTVNVGDVGPFEALVTKFKAACTPACTALSCPPAPSGICDPGQADPQRGVCR
jgi:hypothetical protein